MALLYFKMFGLAFYYGTCVAAALRGDRPLRYAGAAIMANAVVSPISQWGHADDQPFYGTIVIDLALVTGLCLLLLRDRRWWLVAAAGFFLMSVLTHFAALIGSRIPPQTILAGRLLWAYATVGAVAVGLLRHELRRRTSRRVAD